MKRYLIPSPRPEEDAKRINDYFLTFLGEVKLPPLKVSPKKIAVSVAEDDTATIPLIRNLNLRVFDPRLKAYLPADPNLLSVAGQTSPVFKRYGLAPLLRYKNSLVFFCLDKRGRVHLINRHLLEYLNSHPRSKKDKNFSVVVAKNISLFIALVDRGLVPLDYYSRVPLTRAAKRFICFQFDAPTQSFVQTNRELKSLPKKSLAVKVNPDVGFELVRGRLRPYLNVSVYLE